MKPFFIILSTVFIIISCSSTKNETHDAVFKNPKTVDAGHDISLLNMIRRLPGVTVRGSGENVTIRVFAGGNSFVDKTEPMYLVNGIDYGKKFTDIEGSIDVFSVKSVTVLKTAAEIAPYGVRGANGVINIVLK